MIKELALKDIRTDGGTQQRDLDKGFMSKYMALMKEGTEFPPVSVVFDGTDNWLWDGFHRFHCTRKIDKYYIKADITEGTKRDAIFRSFGANAVHGLPRPHGVAKKNIIKILKDKEWCTASQSEIAMAVGVTNQYVCKVQQDYKKSKKQSSSLPEKENVPEPQGTEPVEPEPATEKTVLDSVGQEVPEHLVEIFNRRLEITEYVRKINVMFRKIKEAVAANDELYANCKVGQLKSAVGNVRSNLRFTLPYAVCGYCGGDVNNTECRACNGRGWVNELSYKATPEEMK